MKCEFNSNKSNNIDRDIINSVNNSDGYIWIWMFVDMIDNFNW